MTWESNGQWANIEKQAPIEKEIQGNPSEFRCQDLSPNPTIQWLVKKHFYSGVGGWMLIDPLSQFNGRSKSVFTSSWWSKWMDVD